MPYLKSGFPDGAEDLTANVRDVRDVGSIPGLGRSPGEGNGYPLQYSVLENPMDCPWGHEDLDATEPPTLSRLPFRD